MLCTNLPREAWDFFENCYVPFIKNTQKYIPQNQTNFHFTTQRYYKNHDSRCLIPQLLPPILVDKEQLLHAVFSKNWKLRGNFLWFEPLSCSVFSCFKDLRKCLRWRYSAAGSRSLAEVIRTLFITRWFHNVKLFLKFSNVS